MSGAIDSWRGHEQRSGPPISITVYSVNDTPSIVSSGLSHNSFQTFQNSSSTILPPIVINDDEPDKSLSISISVSSGAIELGSSR